MKWLRRNALCIASVIMIFVGVGIGVFGVAHDSGILIVTGINSTAWAILAFCFDQSARAFRGHE